MKAKILKDTKKEVTCLLSDLIKIDTTNPPGNETKLANFVAKSLEKDGIKSEIIESAPGRGSIISRLKGTGEKPSLLLLSHLDVVTANPKDWSVGPFKGIVKAGYVYGRGAYDIKCLTAIEMMIMKLLKRNNAKLKGDIVLAATADEEKGGEGGAGYLLRNHREKVWCPYVINEGGGLAIPTKNGYVFTVQTAEKGLLWLKVKARGTPSHGSTPNMADNAIMRMNKVIEKLSNYQFKIFFVPTIKQFLKQISKQDTELKETFSHLLTNPKQSEQILNELAKKDRVLAEEIRPRIRMTVAPTMVHGGIQENIIPSDCEAVFDCRILPGQKIPETMVLIKKLLKDVSLEKLSFEFIQAHDGSESPIRTPLYIAITNVLNEFQPGCGITPTLATGGTDSRFFRQEGSICYGFLPMIPDEPNDKLEQRMHGIDERITTENLVFGTSVIYEVVKRFTS